MMMWKVAGKEEERLAKSNAVWLVTSALTVVSSGEAGVGGGRGEV
jgi:hypothetical protein